MVSKGWLRTSGTRIAASIEAPRVAPSISSVKRKRREELISTKQPVEEATDPVEYYESTYKDQPARKRMVKPHGELLVIVRHDRCACNAEDIHANGQRKCDQEQQ